MPPAVDSATATSAAANPARSIIEPIPLLQLPFLVPELQAEIEILRVAVYNLVESRRKLLDALESCATLEDLKVTIRGFYLESARPEVVDGLKHARGIHAHDIENTTAPVGKP